MEQILRSDEKHPDETHVENAINVDNQDIRVVVEREIWNGINRQTVLAFLAICGQLTAYEMTLLIPANAVSYINAELGPSPSSVWINVTWALGAAVSVSVSGRLADIFGRRYFMLVGALVSFIGTIVGATGQNIAQMIVAGVMFGLGSGVQEMGYACIMEFIPNKYRLNALGLYGTSGLLCLFSPLITYAFIAHTSIGWRGAYWYMCAWHGGALIFLFLFYHPPTFATKHQEEQISKLKLILEMDYVGLFLFTTGCTLFLVGLNFGGRQFAWKSAPVIASIIVGFTLLVILFVWIFNANLKYPLLPPKLFRQWRGYNSFVLVGFCCGMLYYSMQVMWPRQAALLFVSASDPIMRGVYANINAWATWVSLVSVWAVCARFSKEKWQILFFICCQIAFIGGLSTVGVNDKGKAITLVFLMSCCINQPFYILFNMVSLSIEDQRDMGAAIGALSSIRLMGGAIATAIYSAIVDNQFAQELPGKIAAAVVGTNFDKSNLDLLIQAATANTPRAYAEVPGITQQIILSSEYAVKLAYVQGYKVVYYAALGFAILAICSALMVRDVDPAKKTLDKAVVLENEKAKAVVVEAEYNTLDAIEMA